MQVRQTRLKMMGETNQTSYDDINNIKFEILRLIFTKYAWPSIDVSRRSVEETSASVIKIYNTKGIIPLKKIAITGQIGTGKSVLLNQFKFLGYKTYSSDQMVKDYMQKINNHK